ncbi:TPA: hypothetical protein ENG04_03770 [Candidatus Poribacteria bacterium]|nr:hypothetical protein [Candidatus Poribacteria bacterium]HEX29179.1 hypothetical protein [Candidatus Poribacteria bacterium]
MNGGGSEPVLTVRLSTKGQVVIPKEIREKLAQEVSDSLCRCFCGRNRRS